MKQRIGIIVLLTAFALTGAGACLGSHLENGFDMKTPKGFLGYLPGALSGRFCILDSSDTFENCKFGP